MRVTITFDGQSPQERVTLRRFEKLAQVQPRRSASPFPYSWLERATLATLCALDRIVRRLVCAYFR